jgi:hypothetical protein
LGELHEGEAVVDQRFQGTVFFEGFGDLGLLTLDGLGLAVIAPEIGCGLAGLDVA